MLPGTTELSPGGVQGIDCGGNAGRGTRIVTAEINVDRLAAARVRSPRIRPREDRRTDVYEIRIGGNSY